MQVVLDDGGRQAAGFKGLTGDCVVRSVCIAGGLDYATVYAALTQVNAQTRRRGKQSKPSPRNGVDVRGVAFKRFMQEQGFTWTPTMKIGSGCKVHLTDGELPPGRLVVVVSKHYTAVIDGVIHDTFDPQRQTIWYEEGKPVRVSERCVYGYWTKEAA